MYEQYGMGQYPFPWGGVTPPPNWQPQTPPMQQSQQGIQGVRFVSGIEEAKNCTIPLGSKALLMNKEKDRFYLKETDITGVSTVSEFEFKKVEAEALQGQVNQLQLSLLSVALSAILTPPRLPLGTIHTSTLMRADAEPRSKLLPSIFGSLGRRGRKSSPPGVKGAHNGC